MAFRFRHSAVFGLVLLAATTARSEQPSPRATEAAVAYFEKEVRPILVKHCYACHSAETKPSGGLRVDDRKGLLTGGSTGPAIVPGKPEQSLLLKRVAAKEVARRMPKQGNPLTDRQVAVLTRWIKDGAAWPAIELPSSLGKAKTRYEKLKKDHWAWQPLTAPAVPAVKDAAWARTDIDRFLLAKLEAKGLKPVGDADRTALLRRTTFDLTGLPPTPEAIDAFLKDRSADAFVRVVDGLLTSPQFGERWGRHWLDVARFGESTGPSRNVPYPHAWRYRNYVIDSVNRDVPFDRFLLEQVAGDLLPANSERDRDRLLTATGFLALGVKDVNQRFKIRFVMDNIDEQIDVVTRSALALTVSCARCHDHKFDPIPTTDYYALAGIFTSTDNCAGLRNQMGGGGLAFYVPSMLQRLSTKLPPPSPEKVRQVEAQVAKAKAAFDAVRGEAAGGMGKRKVSPKQRQLKQRYDKLRADLQMLTDPTARTHAVHGLRESKTIGDTELRVRGEAEKVGPVVPRGFLTAFEVPGAAKINPKQSGRLELAQWLTSPKNPLTPRVIVNRVWGRLFDQGIVNTVDNFGVTGDRPSHPELLDHLTSRFLAEGWSVKKLVRSLVLTRAYQLSADATPAHLTADPANRLIWRHAPRRLDAEELRDAMLASAGRLDLKRPEGSPVKDLQMREMQDTGAEARAIHEFADQSTNRSVYLPLVRGLTPHTLEAFDPVEQTLVTGRRDTTTVPGQALYLLNAAFVRRQAQALAENLLGQKESADAARIQRAYLLTLGRVPATREVERMKTFLAEYQEAYRKEAPAAKQDPASAAWLALAQALYGSAEFRYVK